MCWGDTAAPRFDLNDETAWSGGPGSEAAQGGPTETQSRILLAEARTLLASGMPVAAEVPVTAMQSGHTQAYLPLGTLQLRLPVPVTGDYRRTLDMATAVHTVTQGGLTQRTVASHRYGVLVHIIEGLPDGVIPEALLTSPLRVLGHNATDNGSELHLRLPSDVAPGHERDLPPATWSDAPGASLQAAIVARVVTEVAASGASRVVVFVASGTTYRGPLAEPTGTAADAAAAASARISAAVDAGSDRVLADHVADHGALFGRVSLDVGPAGDDAPDGRNEDLRPTASRIAAASLHPGGPLATDPSLAALLFDYGRYLLISSSRPGGLPATLQGIWNDAMQPPWSSNYTTNINLQMNYWGADVANLAETAEPLLALVEALAAAGNTTARRLYGSEGWVAHHNSDAWAFTSPVGGGHGDPSWSFWPMAGPWLVRHLTDRVEFGDDAFAARAWPVVRGAALFALDLSIRLPDGSWGTSPSTSPENQFVTPDGSPASLGTSSTMDIALLRELFGSVATLAARLGITDDPVVAAAASRLAGLPATAVPAPGGGIREWSDDTTALDPHHRHLSLLYDLYPATTALDDGQLAAAAQTLTDRGDDSTGWSLVWKLALWARLGRADKVSDLLRLVFRPAATMSGPFAGGLYPNLFAAHPPFQIDGNLGFVGALAEALLQSHGGRIELLPALPAELSTGRVTGLVARGGILVDIDWADGKLVGATVRSRTAVEVTVRYRGRDITRAVDAAAGVRLGADDFDRPTSGLNIL
jgi:alpha-L-fucosidase 2